MQKLLRYRPGWCVRCSAPSPHASYQQALAGLSPLNFSRPKDFPSVPEVVTPGRSVSRHPSSRRWRTLNEPSRLATEGPDPVRGFGSHDSAYLLRLTIATADDLKTHGAMPVLGKQEEARSAASPSSSSTTAQNLTARLFSVVPPPIRGVDHEIE